MNHVDCVIKRDVYLQKMHSCSKNIRGLSFLFEKYPWYIKKKKKKYIYIMGDIAWVFRVVERKTCLHVIDFLFNYNFPKDPLFKTMSPFIIYTYRNLCSSGNFSFWL